MSLRNELLCWFLGPAGAPLPVAALADLAEEASLAAMCLARAGQVDGFDAALRELPDDEVAMVSRHCLFLALSGQPRMSLPFFDALKRRAPTCADVWIDLCVLQLACDLPEAALRSAAVHAALTGQDGVGQDGVGQDAMGWDAGGDAADAPGRIRFIPGDAVSFTRA